MPLLSTLAGARGFGRSGLIPEIPGVFELIATQFVASDTNQIEFTGLNDYHSRYRHLQLRWTISVGGSADLQMAFLRFNNSSSGYRSNAIYAYDNTVRSSSAGSAQSYTELAYYSTSYGTPRLLSGVTDIVDAFQTNKTKVVKTMGGRYSTGSNGFEGFMRGGLWNNAAAITSILISRDGSPNTIGTGSRFSLYGIRSANA